MIRAKILFIEHELVRNPSKNEEMLNAIESVKKMLKQIDFKVEVVPLENTKSVCKLLESLKNEPLTNKEKLIAKKLVEYN
jgi:pantothenate synthetase